MFDFQSVMHTGSFSLQTVALTLLVSLILGIVIALVYKSSHCHTSSFAVMLAILPVLESFIIMMINGNVGASIVVLGAFGLVRFRSATGSAWDIGFIFFSMAVGLAIGLGYYTLAAVVTVFAGFALYFLERLNFGQSAMKEKQLRITIPESMEYNHVFDDLFSDYTYQCRLERVRTVEMGTMFELCYHIVMKNPDQEKELIDAIRCRNGNLSVILSTVLRNKDEL